MRFVWTCLYGFFLWILVWRFGIPLYLCRILVGKVMVFNRGKICIEKMLGFRGDDVRFFFNPCFCFSHNLAITHSN